MIFWLVFWTADIDLFCDVKSCLELIILEERKEMIRRRTTPLIDNCTKEREGLPVAWRTFSLCGRADLSAFISV